MTLIENILPPREPALFEIALDLQEVDLLNKALEAYINLYPKTTTQLQDAMDLHQGFITAYQALRADEERRLVELL